MSEDKYRNFAALAADEAPAAYHIVTMPRGTATVLVAPHGGAIEPGTSELARAIAGAELSFYLFEGRKGAGNREDLHITSTNFDEPQCLQLVMQAQVAVAIHGESSEDEAIVFLGGRDAALGDTLKQRLEQAGFSVQTHPKPHLQGVHPDNICNRGLTGAGVQLELSRALRLEMFPSLTAKGRAAPRKRFHDFVRAVRAGLGLPPG